jgi:capsular polysaccharide biosynthesis protein/Mrp family chromosome partitioning ATPase
MTVSSREDHFELADYLSVLRRRWWIVLVLTLVGVLVGGIYAKVAPKTYTGSVLVQVNPLPISSNATTGRTAGSVNMDNEAQIVQSETVASQAARLLHSPLSAQDLVKQVKVSVPPNTTYLQINCKAPSATGAAQCASAFASAYLTYRQSSAVSAVSSTLTALDKRISSLQTQIRIAKTQLASLPANSSQATATQLQLSFDNTSISAAETSANNENSLLASLNQTQAVGSIATPATPPTTPTSPRLLLLGPSGLLAGLLIGLLTAFFVDRRDTRIHTARDVDRYLDVPVLLDAAPKKTALQSGLASPRSKIGQAFTELGQYVAGALGEGNHVLLVVGTSAGPGGSLVSANLAAALARTRAEVVLVCADARMITPQLLGIGDGPGLSELLAGRATVSDVARRPPDLARLRVITPGGDSLSDLLYLQHDACGRMLAELHRGARYVVVETQSVGDDADAFTLAQFADAALLAVEVGGSTRPDVLDCVQRLDRLRTPVLGATVLEVSTSWPAARLRPPHQPTQMPKRRWVHRRGIEDRLGPADRPADGQGRPVERPARQRPALDRASSPPDKSASRSAKAPDGASADPLSGTPPEPDIPVTARTPGAQPPGADLVRPPDRPHKRTDYADPADKVWKG